MRTPKSVIDAGRRSMSRRAVLDGLYSNATEFMISMDIFDKSERIYNIDESWFGGKNESKHIQIVNKHTKIPYMLNDIRIEHVTFTMCISASGDILPSMFTLLTSLPTNHEFHKLGPERALYTISPDI